MKMTKKHFETVAARLRKARETALVGAGEFSGCVAHTLDLAVLELSEAFADCNDKFDRVKFERAAGYANWNMRVQ